MKTAMQWSLKMDNARTMLYELSTIRERIENTADRCGRKPGEVRLVAVGKTQPIERIRQAIASGADIIGENYIQESREKFEQLVQMNAQWHFIGHLQSNKAKYAVRIFDLIHTVDSLKLARTLDQQAKKIDKIQSVLVQVNISGEQTKSGIEETQAFELVQNLRELKNIKLQGLMTMPPFFDAPEKARPFFASLRHLRDAMEDQLHIELRDLSMGMTGDFEVAIEEGATLVRIGTALFGNRK